VNVNTASYNGIGVDWMNRQEEERDRRRRTRQQPGGVLPWVYFCITAARGSLAPFPGDRLAYWMGRVG
jgi:hypothetical protein